MAVFFGELDELDELDDDESDDDDDGDGSRTRFSVCKSDRLVTGTNDRSDSDRWRTLGALALLDLPDRCETCESEQTEKEEKKQPTAKNAKHATLTGTLHGDRHTFLSFFPIFANPPTTCSSLKVHDSRRKW